MQKRQKREGKTEKQTSELFVPAENTDYFDKVCDPVPAAKRSAVEGVTTIPQSNAIDTNEDDRVTSLVRADEEEVSKAVEYIMTSTPPDEDDVTTTSNIVGQKETEAEGTVIDDIAEFENAQRSPRLSSVCHMSGINVNVEFASPTSGSIYIKDHFATCRMEFSNATESFLNIPFPTNDDPNPKCPGTEIAPSMWSFSVIVQKNDMGSPSLVTSTDRMFNVSCDYTEIEKEKGSTTITSEGGNEVTSTRIEMQILRNGHAVTTVPLGEEVELKWTIIDTTDGLGYFVDECKAERVGGSPPEPEPLKLIENG
ncbi:unnamed protein product [Cylicostephanus goldi]|uniref:ZP domain-containing protein n=1 Tax=Cylicostephanus goldi TaxID=71465 RepID=A0A3P7MLZ0_CYLGO|nr:unnamed protein product [Cylicostephanus goldi]